MRDKYINLSGRSVLMVEDEEIVSEALKEVMGPIVSTVETARNGEEALAKILKRDFDYILLDIKMPRMNGMDFFRHMSVLKPCLTKRVIFITGDTESEITRSFIRANGGNSLNKPFGIWELLDMLAKSG
ncbi:MAG: response regulator [Deltaproteobacteria bacterium]|nr:response regulator [Deltaproteobacteria bacterium]